MITNVYDPILAILKPASWDNLSKGQKNYKDLPWILGSDLNLLSCSHEKRGTKVSSVPELPTTIINIEEKNQRLTLNKRRTGRDLVMESLDRFLNSDQQKLGNQIP